MVFDPEKLNADIANLFDREEKRAREEVAFAQEQECSWHDLITLARIKGFTLPDELTVNTGTPDERPVEFREFEALTHLILRSPESPARLAAVSDAFYTLMIAKTSAIFSGPDDEYAIDARDTAIGIIFEASAFAQAEKESFLALANEYLANLVDPIELPPVPGVNAFDEMTAIGRVIMDRKDREQEDFAHNAQIRHALKPGLDKELQEIIGDHDDINKLHSLIFLAAARLILERRQAESTTGAEISVDEIIKSYRLEKLAEEFGLDVNHLAQVVLTISGMMQTMGYRM